jgi:hypothetical protein
VRWRLAERFDKLTQSAQIARRVNPAGQVFVPAGTTYDKLRLFRASSNLQHDAAALTG